MTKKDFLIIAIALRNRKPSEAVYPDNYDIRYDTWEDVVDEVASQLEDNYPRFDRDTFVRAAAGYKI